MVKGCGKQLKGEPDVLYLNPDDTYFIRWNDRGAVLPFLYVRTCGSYGEWQGRKQHICLACAKKLGLLW